MHKKNKQIAGRLLILTGCLLLMAIPSLARPDFDVHPRTIEHALHRVWTIRDTLRIDNSRGHGADETLRWEVNVSPADQEWLRVYFIPEEGEEEEETIHLAGQVEPGERQFFVVAQRGRNLEEGHYYVDLNFTSNDPTREEYTVPVAGHRAPFPTIETGWRDDWGEWWGVDMNQIFGVIHYGDVDTFYLSIRNRGSALLEVEEIRTDNGYWEIVPDQFEVNPDRAQRVGFIFTAEELAQNAATITSVSNAWDPRELNFRIVAEVSPVFRLRAEIPDMEVSEDSGEFQVVRLDTIFFSSNRSLEYEVEAEGLSERIARNSEFYLTPVRNFYGESEVIVSATDEDSTLVDTFMVTVLPQPDPPAAFDLLSPAHEDTIRWDGVDSMFAWQSSSDVDGDTLIYTLYIWADEDSVHEYVSIMDSTYSIDILDEIIDLEAGGEINWTVNVTDGEFTVDAWSTFTNCVVPLAAGFEELYPLEFGISEVYPNPFNSVVRIKIDVPGYSNLRISIFDYSGRLVETIENSYVNPGTKVYAWRPLNAPSGKYIIRAVDGTVESIMPVVFSK